MGWGMPGGWELGDFPVPGSHGLSHPPARSREAGGHWERPNPRHQAPHWRCAKARPGHGSTGGSSSVGPMAAEAGLWGAGGQPCSGVTGAGADGPRGLPWGPGLWAGWGNPREAGQG